MKYIKQLATLYLLAIVLVVTLVTHLKAEAYQSVQLRPLTEIEEAKLYLFEQLNSDVNKYNLMSRIAYAESDFNQDAYNSETHDVGIFQVNEGYHLERSKELGYDIYTYRGNIDYAVTLYERSGTSPWKASKARWSKV